MTPDWWSTLLSLRLMFIELIINIPTGVSTGHVRLTRPRLCPLLTPKLSLPTAFPVSVDGYFILLGSEAKTLGVLLDSPLSLTLHMQTIEYLLALSFQKNCSWLEPHSRKWLWVLALLLVASYGRAPTLEWVHQCTVDFSAHNIELMSLPLASSLVMAFTVLGCV